MSHEDTIDEHLIRSDFTERAPWTMQAASEVVPPYDATELILLAQSERQPGEPLFIAAQRMITERSQMLEMMSSAPLTSCFIPDEWWLFMEQIAEKRYAHPGLPLVFWCSGGIRSGKTFIAALLTVCHWLHMRTKRQGNKRVGADVYCMTSRLDQSARLQQRPMYSFMPAEILAGNGRGLQGEERMRFKGGHFTDDSFCRFVKVEDDQGRVYEGGGSVTFAADTQQADEDMHKLQGMDLTAAWLDEGKNPDILKTMRERVATGATITGEAWHRELIFTILKKLRLRGTPQFRRLTPYEMGMLLCGIVMNTYTPKEGWNEMAASQLTGAEFPEQFMIVAPELKDKPGVLDDRVPLIAYPVDKYCLVGFLPTRANKAKGGVLPAVLSTLGPSPSEEEIRKVLYGMVGKSEDVLFPHFNTRHLKPWTAVPRNGTLYVVADQAYTKPWSISIVMWDKPGRLWWLMDWPTPGRKMRVLDRGEWKTIDPGPWAMPSENPSLRNGKKGPIARRNIGYVFDDYTHLIWQLLQEVLAKFDASGGKFEGSVETHTLSWKEGKLEDLTGQFAKPYAFIGDKNWLGSRTVGRAKNDSTLLEALDECENPHAWEPYEGRSARDGIERIQEALALDIGGLPGLIVMEDCTDTAFALRTYTVPEGKDSPPNDDQACKEAIDKMRYVFRWPERFVDTTLRTISGGGSF